MFYGHNEALLKEDMSKYHNSLVPGFHKFEFAELDILGQKIPPGNLNSVLKFFVI